MLKIYIAGPDVFFKDSLELGVAKKEICEKYGFEGIYPLDLLPADLFSEKYTSNQQAKIIKEACKNGILDCDILVANMTPFRGVSMDVGTACEIGMADMVDKIIYGYSLDDTHYLDKLLNAGMKLNPVDNVVYDMDGSVVEDFAKIDNCMVTDSCKEIMFTENNFESNIEIFERLIKKISGIYNV